MRDCVKELSWKLYSDNNNGSYIVTLTAGMSAINDADTIQRGWELIADFCRDNNVVIVHERIFASKESYPNVIGKRKEVFAAYEMDTTSPFTFVCSKTLEKEGLAGIQLYCVSRNEWSFKNIFWNGQKVGYKCDNDKVEMIILHSMHDDSLNKLSCKSAYDQTVNFFNSTNKILTEEGFSFQNVCRTWIYLHEILNQYDLFNKARNKVFHEYGLLKAKCEEFEKIYMPASTGIEGGNIYNASGIMDVMAVKVKCNEIHIFNENGRLQNSAFRYGSAFSRSMIIEDLAKRQLYLSGTASIDRDGKSVFLNNIEMQIENTFSIIRQLIQKQGFTINDLSEATVFLKDSKYVEVFKQYCRKNNLEQLPFVVVVSNVCRNNLLFEMDAIFQIEIKNEKL